MTRSETYKMFLRCACRIIRAEKGVITAFDGDRVMAVFLGDYQETCAVRAGLKINYAVGHVINPTLRSPPHRADGYQLKHSVGIDSSNVMAARTGIRNNNDLVWVGHAANNAAKLASRSETGFATNITKAVFSAMNQSVKYCGSDCMWLKKAHSGIGTSVYSSGYHWILD